MEPTQASAYMMFSLCAAALILGGSIGSLLTRWIIHQQQFNASKAYQQFEAALRQSEARLRCFIESNLIGVVVADINGTIFEANDAFLEMVGYTQEDLRAGLNWAAMTPPEYAPLDQQAVEEQITKGACLPFEKEYFRKDGSRVPVYIGCAIFDQSQQISIGFMLDLTDRKQAEMAAVLAERNSIAREIHDSLGQAFSSIIAHLDVARKLDDLAAAQDCIQTSYEVAQSGLAEVRRSLVALRPRVAGEDLYRTLYLLAKQIFAHNQVQLHCNQQGEPYALPPTHEHHLLRIGQEALMNACKHAKASQIHLELKYDPVECVLRIKDNGVGFALNDSSDSLSSSGRGQKISLNSGFGLLNIAERAEDMGAQLTIQTAPGQGTEVTIVVKRERVNESI